jgi:hypothetical protein
MLRRFPPAPTLPDPTAAARRVTQDWARCRPNTAYEPSLKLQHWPVFSLLSVASEDQFGERTAISEQRDPSGASHEDLWLTECRSRGIASP